MSLTNFDNNSKNLQALEVITPHKIAIATLIREYCEYWCKCYKEPTLSSKSRRDFCILILKLLQSPDLSLNELRNLLSSSKFDIVPHVIETFDESLSLIYENGSSTLLDCIESLQGKMGICELLTSRAENTCFISKNSVVGLYFRRLIVSFEILTFSEVTKVYLTFRKYYEEGQKTRNAVPKPLPAFFTDDWSANREQWSRRQAELFIATQAALLSNNEERALPPQELQNRITDLLKSNPTLSHAHYLSYLNHMRVKDFCQAMNSLHHCFDRSTLPDYSSSTSEDKQRVYRFASLNLSILHYHFGHKEEALTSLKETIRIAQQANDNICLQHALCWLYRLTDTDKDKLIEHSIAKSCDLNLSYTASLGIQTFVKNGCLTAEDPQRIFDTLTKGDVINCKHNLTGLISSSYAVKAGLWSYYGKRDMCGLWSQLLLYLNMNQTNDSKSVYGEAFCLAICTLARHLLQEGRYHLVYTIVNFAKERFANEPIAHTWMLTENIFVFTRALRHENYTEAEGAAQKILVFDKWEGYLKLAELCYYREDYTEARRFIDTLIARFQSSPKYKLKMSYYIRALVLRAEVQLSSNYEGVPPGMMTLLTNALIEAQRYHMDEQVAVIRLHLAQLQYHLGMEASALNLLDKCLIQVLAHGGCYERGRAMLLYVKCQVRQAASREPPEQRQILGKAVEMLGKVSAEFKAVEAFSRVKDVLYFQAQLYNTLNQRAERNQCAYEYRLLEEERPSKNVHTLLKYL